MVRLKAVQLPFHRWRWITARTTGELSSAWRTQPVKPLTATRAFRAGPLSTNSHSCNHWPDSFGKRWFLNSMEASEPLSNGIAHIVIIQFSIWERTCYKPQNYKAKNIKIYPAYVIVVFCSFFFLNRELSVHITRRPCDVNVGVAPIDYRTCAFPRFFVVWRWKFAYFVHQHLTRVGTLGDLRESDILWLMIR